VDLVEEASSRILGENPCDIDRLYTEMVDGLSAQGSIGGAAVTAISGLEIALHDLAGKLLGVPAYQLLGGKYRDDVRVYVDCHAGAHSTEDAEGDVYSPSAYADPAEEYDVWWLEDLVPPKNDDVQREVTRRTATTVCTGENRYRKHGFRDMIEEQAVDNVQPDMPKVGGMRETVKIAEWADTYYVALALHNVSTPLGTVAGAHVATAARTFLAIEYHSRKVDWWDDVVEESVMEDGRLRVPAEPGLGVTLDRDVVADHLLPGETTFDPAEAA